MNPVLDDCKNCQNCLQTVCQCVDFNCYIFYFRTLPETSTKLTISGNSQVDLLLTNNKTQFTGGGGFSFKDGYNMQIAHDIGQVCNKYISSKYVT